MKPPRVRHEIPFTDIEPRDEWLTEADVPRDDVAREIAEVVWRHQGILCPFERECCERRFCLGESVSEISKALHIRNQTITTILQTATRKLANHACPDWLSCTDCQHAASCSHRPRPKEGES